MVNKIKTWVIGIVITVGIVLVVVGACINKEPIMISVGSGLLTAGITTGLIELSNHVEFNKRRAYRRALELRYLIFEMFQLYKYVTNQEKYSSEIDVSAIYDSKTEEEKKDIQSWIKGCCSRIAKELNAIIENQNYLSLSGYFTEQEITYLCRSINYYDGFVDDFRAKVILKNMSEILCMFKDIIK